MRFYDLARYFERIELSSGRIDMTNILVDLFRKATSPEEIAMITYLLIGEIHPPYVGLELGLSEKLIIRAIGIASGYDTSEIEKRLLQLGDIGRVAEEFISKKRQMSLFVEELTVKKVYDTFDRISRISGEGAISDKLNYLSGLLINAHPIEARYIARIADGTLRIGIADMTILDALALAFGSKEWRPILENAYNVMPDIGKIASILYEGGIEAIKKIDVTIGIPVRPMLAERLQSPEEIWAKTRGRLIAEFKYDGERVQVHRDDNKVYIFSRRLENITNQFPDVVKVVKERVKGKRFIIEAEAVAINPETGEMLPFQELMHRKRKYDIEKVAREIPVCLKVFDVLYHEEKGSFLKVPLLERRKFLESIIEPNEFISLSEMIVPKSVDDLWRFFHLAIESGCEGLVCKATTSDSIYQAGARGWLWIKFKRDYRAELSDTLDLVVVGAFYGRGRKAGIPSSFLMAVYDPEKDVFKTVCKVGTGFTDDQLAYMHKLVNQYRVERKPARVESLIEPDFWVMPQIVLEITAAEITLSPVHTCALDVIEKGAGLALRFPRFTGRFREDKSPEDATTEKEIIEIYRRQRKTGA